MHNFETFWTAYPKKVAKGQARRTWEKLNESGVLPGIDAILEAIAWQIRDEDFMGGDPKFIPYPSTWLNAERWADEKPRPKSIAPRRIPSIFEHKDFKDEKSS